MTAYKPLHHVREREPSPLAKFFRRLVAAWQRRGAAAPVLSPAGAAATTLLASVPLSADMPTGEFAVLDAKVDALRRPRNGVYRGTQPRYTRVDHPELPGNDFGVRPQLEVLTRLRDALREMA